MDLYTNICARINGTIRWTIASGEVVRLIEKPKHAEQGDFAFPCFSLAKIMRKAPHLIAVELAGKYPNPSL